MIQIFMSRQFMLFLFAGGIAAVVNFGCRIVYNRWMEFSAAIILAYLTGMVTAFILSKLFVFKGGRQGIPQSALIFSLVNLVAVLQTWVVSMGLACYLLPWMKISQFVPEISHAIGVVVPVFTSYIGHKRWSFS